MPIVPCQVCSKQFYVKPNRLVRGWGKYCSKECNNLAQKTGKIVNCHNCGKETYKKATDQRRSRSGKFFCNKSCQTIWRNREVFIGENHGNWTGGESSYRQRLKREDTEQICQKCKTLDTRVLAVHHTDRNRQNNKISNLIWLCHNCHYLVHHSVDEARGYITG